MNVGQTTTAFQLNELRQEVLKLTPDENRLYLLNFLYEHAHAWAVKHYGMADDNARSYAYDYVEEFGDVWITQVWAPQHWEAIRQLRPLEDAA